MFREWMDRERRERRHGREVVGILRVKGERGVRKRVRWELDGLRRGEGEKGGCDDLEGQRWENEKKVVNKRVVFEEVGGDERVARTSDGHDDLEGQMDRVGKERSCLRK